MKYEITIRNYKGGKLVKTVTKIGTMTVLRNLEKKGYTVTLMGNRAVVDR